MSFFGRGLIAQTQYHWAAFGFRNEHEQIVVFMKCNRDLGGMAQRLEQAGKSQMMADEFPGVLRLGDSHTPHEQDKSPTTTAHFRLSILRRSSVQVLDIRSWEQDPRIDYKKLPSWSSNPKAKIGILLRSPSLDAIRE